jgi:transcriptional regulator with XRE-family HTH domain
MNQEKDIVNTSTRVTHAVKIAVLLRALRNAFGLSQSELAQQAKCSRPTINRIETLDKASPRSDIVDDLLQVFRDNGAEIQLGDEEVSIRFTKDALLNATVKLQKPTDSGS